MICERHGAFFLRSWDSERHAETLPRQVRNPKAPPQSTAAPINATPHPAPFEHELEIPRRVSASDTGFQLINSNTGRRLDRNTSSKVYALPRECAAEPKLSRINGAPEKGLLINNGLRRATSAAFTEARGSSLAL